MVIVVESLVESSFGDLTAVAQLLGCKVAVLSVHQVGFRLRVLVHALFSDPSLFWCLPIMMFRLASLILDLPTILPFQMSSLLGFPTMPFPFAIVAYTLHARLKS